jgi:uncharacterized membrane protein
MSDTSFQILRQSGWDLWVWLCILASAVLVCYALFARLWSRRGGWLPLSLIAFGVGGTALIASTPPLHSPLLGLFWTLLVMGILAAVFYLNLREQLGSVRMTVLLMLRWLALALLVPMLFEPILQFTQQPVARRPLAFLIDTSGSMSVPDVPNGPARIQSVWLTLAPLLPTLRQHFVPRFFSFSTGCVELNQAEDLATISADGKSTDFATAVAKAAGDLSADKDASIVLVSDGNDNVSPNVADILRQAQRKIHTVSVGSPLAQPANLINIAVASVVAPEDAEVGHEVKLTATIQNTALANRVVDVNLAEVDDSGKPTGAVSSQRLVLQPDPDGQKVDLLYTPRATGVRHLAIWIDPIPGQRNVADNRQDIQLLAVQGRVKVLYIEGALRPEYTYLNRMLGHNADVELATLLRLQEDRFAAGGTVDGQPFTAIPETADEWNKFDVILIGDLNSSFLSPTEQAMIRQRVSDGGGMVMIGGQKNFGAGGYQSTPLEEVLPVFVGGLDMPQDRDEFVPLLTPEGTAHPIIQQLTDWFPAPGKAAAKTLSPLKGNVVVAGPKSGAQVLLVHPGEPGPDGHEQIVLAVQQYGKGRSAAFTADTTNIWYRQFREQGQDSAYNRFWGQLLLWLAGQDARNREKGSGLQALLNKSVYSFGESVALRAVVRDAHGDTTQFATVSATITSPALAQPLQESLTPVEGHTGTYELALPEPGSPGLAPGEYSVEMTATKDNATLGNQKLKFSVIPPEDEMLKIAANIPLMQEIATDTGGYCQPLAELPELVDTLIQTDPAAAVQTVQRTLPLSNTLRVLLAAAGHDAPWPAHTDLPMEGALVLLLLISEWVLRRKWQVP